MNLKIIDIKNKGDFEKEHILLKANSDLELSHYLILFTETEGIDKISSGSRLCYWFSPMSIKKGDYIRLFTKEGKYHFFTNKSKTTTYEFYLFMDSDWFSKQEDVPVLMHINEWITHYNK